MYNSLHTVMRQFSLVVNPTKIFCRISFHIVLGEIGQAKEHGCCGWISCGRLTSYIPKESSCLGQYAYA